MKISEFRIKNEIIRKKDGRSIESVMHELESILHLEFKKISYLECAMYVQKIDDTTLGKNNSNYANNSLATVGDSVLKFILSDLLYNESLNRGDITEYKKLYESNEALYNFSQKYKIFEYAFNDTAFFNDAPEHDRLPNKRDIHSMWRRSSAHIIMIQE